MKITIFTRKNCRKCEDIIDVFKEDNCPFHEKIINTDLTYKNEFKQYGFVYVPAIVVVGDNGNIVFMRDGISLETIEEIIREEGI